VDGSLHFDSTVHEQAKSNRVCNILQFCRVGLSLGILIFSILHFLHLSLRVVNAYNMRHLREAELWRAVGMDGAAEVQVGAALCVHHTVITRALERYRLHGSPARMHAGGR
jgi:hypothetical protein